MQRDDIKIIHKFQVTNFSFAPEAGPVQRSELVAVVWLTVGNQLLSVCQAANFTVTYCVTHDDATGVFTHRRRCRACFTNQL